MALATGTKLGPFAQPPVKSSAMFEALDQAHRQHDVFLLHIQGLPFFAPYQADPRFEALLKKMNLA